MIDNNENDELPARTTKCSTTPLIVCPLHSIEQVVSGKEADRSICAMVTYYVVRSRRGNNNIIDEEALVSRSIFHAHFPTQQIPTKYYKHNCSGDSLLAPELRSKFPAPFANFEMT